jgi:cytochrome P450
MLSYERSRYPDSNSDSRHCPRFSLQKGLFGRELNVHSVETLRELATANRLRRYRPLVALLRSGLRHRVMIVSDDEEWQRTRDAIEPELRAAAHYTSIIQAVASEVFAGLCLDGPTQVALEPLMRSVTLSILCHMLCGRVLPSEEASLMEAILTVSTETPSDGLAPSANRCLEAIFGTLGIGEYQPVFFARTQRRAIDRILEWIGGRIDSAGRAEHRPPLLERLEKRYSDLSPSRRKRAIAAEYAMLCIAGIETTGAALTLAIVSLANDETVRRAAVQEARRHESSDGADQPVAARFPFLNCVFRETLCRHTIVPTFLREIGKGCLPEGNRRISKGTTLRYLPFQGHLRRTVWDQPYRFNPCRFAGPLTAEQAQHYMPFGFGAQRCPGHAMAAAESILILAEFLRRFDLEPAGASEKRLTLRRNIIFTNRPVGLTARICPVHVEAAEGAGRR